VQDLTYGAQAKHDEKLGFRVFDIYVGIKLNGGGYLSDAQLEAACRGMGLPRVPVLYRGPFSRKVLDEYTNGKETVSGKGMHIREGIVIRPVIERKDDSLGRVQLKSISEKYLLRANGTEFH
jgi:RNA ligase (TIGR02306 family)